MGSTGAGCASGSGGEVVGAGLRAYSGVAPVTKQSGKTKKNSNAQRVQSAGAPSVLSLGSRERPAGRTRPPALSAIARPWTGHGRALRGVCDRLLSILIGILRSGLPYDPNRYRKGNLAPAACVS